MDVKTLCLGILTLRDATGYEIKKQFEEGFFHFYAAGYGSIYPALNQLAAEGLVTFREVEQEKRPDKKVYSITEAGRQCFVNALADTPPRHRVRSEFLVLIFFSQMLSTDRIAEIIEEKRVYYETMLENIATHRDSPEWSSPGARFTMEFGQALAEAAIAFLNDRAPLLLNEIAADREMTAVPEETATGGPQGALAGKTT